MALSQREMDDLKGVLNETVKKFLGFSETSLVSAALNCITKGYDKKKAVDKLSDLLDSGQATHFADKIYSVYEDYRSSSRHAKHKRRKDEGEEVKEVKVKKRRFMDDDEAASIPGPGTPSPGALTAEKIKEMMENARRELQERKAQLGIQSSAPQGPPPATAPKPQPPAAPAMPRPPMPLLGSGGMDGRAAAPPPPPQQSQSNMNDSVEKAKRAAELQSQIQQRLMGLSMGLGGGNLPGMGMGMGMGMPGLPSGGMPGGPPPSMGGKPPAPPLPLGGMPPPLIPGLVSRPPSQQQKQNNPASKPTPVILNELGQTIDAKTGQTIQLSHYTPTLKANIRAKRREQFKGLIEKAPEEIADSKFFDHRMGNKGPARQRRSFKFHEHGKFEQLAQRLRAKAQLERLQMEIAQTAKRTGIASAAKLATILPKKDIREGEVPDMEWWDTFILNKDTYDAVGEVVDRSLLEGITQLVEHPIQLKPPADQTQSISIPVYLTKKERKKLRRQSRQEAEKELQEKIRLGLAPQPEPKVRMANLMRVLGTEAVQDPTKVEAHVRAQMAKRQRAHEEANAARKLTTEQRRDKKIRKIKEDTSLGVNVSVYRVRDLSNPAHKFKLETNSKQLFMTGFVVLYKDCNVVVVEGGPKQQRKFKRLMLHRIKWSEGKKHAKDEDDSDEEEETEKSNRCVLVWEGVVKSRTFSEMKFKTCPTVSFAHEQFNKLGVGHYWDQAFSGAVLETAADD
ncbi:U4/U6 small nuclear ribonucleoprotein Prp3-like [Babylonia areolata]|uniref:U4/U6 small nuclear ribonucleoprotein Prp3-like n=1 Tax=Babylonia areolata TaxID=304850 RepID=UPI003FD1E184